MDLFEEGAAYSLGDSADYLPRFVDFSKAAFAGREALASEQEAGGPPRTLTGLDIDWRAVVEAHLERGVAPNVSPRVEWTAKPVRAGGRPGRAGLEHHFGGRLQGS